jgi:hypothetical protein
MNKDEPQELPYNEALQKKIEGEREAIKKMNNALTLTKRVAQLVGEYYVELRAQGVDEAAALKLSGDYATFVMNQKSS